MAGSPPPINPGLSLPRGAPAGTGSFLDGAAAAASSSPPPAAMGAGPPLGLGLPPFRGLPFLPPPPAGLAGDGGDTPASSPEPPAAAAAAEPGPDDSAFSLPGGMIFPGLARPAQLEIGRATHPQNGSQLVTFRLVLDHGGNPDAVPPPAVLQSMMNLLANRVMSQVLAGGPSARSRSRPTKASVIEALPRVHDPCAWTCGSSCAVCQDSFGGRKVAVRLPCYHVFHRACIKPWLESHNTCPTCRFELETEDDVSAPCPMLRRVWRWR